MTRPRQQRRAEKRGVKLKRDPTALTLLSVHMHRIGITHAEFTKAEIESGPQRQGLRVTVDGNDQEAPVLLALHMERLNVSRIAFQNDELNDPTPGHKTIVDGDDNALRITLVPADIADLAEDLPQFRAKAPGEEKQ